MASFDASGVGITDMKKINFIYGANGSGKTTISNLVANPDIEDYQGCTVSWQHGMPLKALVYNKQFRENNFGRCKNEKTITDDRILVVDDPISSLDSNILFVVSTLLKNLIRKVKNGQSNIKQLILLTHNVYFHKEVSFIDGRSNGDTDTFYWILRKIDKTSSVQPFGMKNPIQTSYELLWQELKDKKNNSGVTIQNTMRRIIENYFKILGKYGDDDLISQFKSKEEQEICRSLICWINDGSHSISDNLYIESPADTIDKYLKVFKDIFKLTRHEGHYNMMMGLEA